MCSIGGKGFSLIFQLNTGETMIKNLNNLESKIELFSKKYDIEQEKTRQLVQAIIEASKAKKPERSKPAVTKPVSPESERIRKALLIMRAGLKEPVTSSELADYLNSDTNTINNNLRWLSNQGIVKQAGVLKTAGRGKNPTLWQFN